MRAIVPGRRLRARPSADAWFATSCSRRQPPAVRDALLGPPAGVRLVRARRLLEDACVVLRRHLVHPIDDLEPTDTAADHDDHAGRVARADEHVPGPWR